MKKIAIIPARSGSKGLPDKNILNLAGKPLIAWTIESARNANCFERIIVTTDSEEYGDISKKYGAEVFYRNKENATDSASMFDAIKEVLDNLKNDEYDYFMLLQPTSPLRNDKHINEAIKLFEENYQTKDTLVSLQKTRKSSSLVKPVEEDMSLKHFDLDYSNYSRQQSREYETNGAIFISKIPYYLKKKHFFGENGIAYIMDKISSIDIDDAVDFELAVLQATKLNKKKEIEKKICTQIEEKMELFKKKTDCSNSIALIGHSQIARWNVKKILNYEVLNYGINGISSFDYDRYILSKNILKNNADRYIVMHGTNDIVYDKSNEEILESIMKSINYIKNMNSNSKIAFVSCINVNGRMDRSNIRINELNNYIKENMEKDIIWIDTKQLNNKYGKLDEKYTCDGLHLNDEGYKIFKQIIEETLENNNV